MSPRPPAPVRSQSALTGVASLTTGTGVPSGNFSLVPVATDSLAPAGHTTTRAFAAPGSQTCTEVVVLTFSRTSVWMLTVVSAANAGGAGEPSAPDGLGWPPSRNTALSTNAGIEMANSLSQYWKACTTVIARIPPPIT